MNKKKYISPAVSLIDMKTYGIMDIQGESRWGVGVNGEQIKILQEDLPEGYEVEAKGGSFIDEADALPSHRSLWDDDED